MKQIKKQPPPPPGAPVTSKPAQPVSNLVFTKKNYMWLLIGAVLILVGFLLMIGGGSADPTQFNPEIFNFRRLTLSPILILTGFGVVIYAIMKKSDPA
ncbi:MAG: DUF3098 domain-containing protein [Bacteroidetes bacterium]|nr:DUF3098 domain-containing protein [Bacteroidota bacterium]MBU1719328.1 DUF3098 domain-containing protein [Bacteroidota bacterium]